MLKLDLTVKIHNSIKVMWFIQPQMIIPLLSTGTNMCKSRKVLQGSINMCLLAGNGGETAAIPVANLGYCKFPLYII